MAHHGQAMPAAATGRISPTREMHPREGARLTPQAGRGAPPGPSAPSVMAWGRKLVMSNRSSAAGGGAPVGGFPSEHVPAYLPHAHEGYPVHGAQEAHPHSQPAGRAAPHPTMMSSDEWRSDPVVKDAVAAHPAISTELSNLASAKDDPSVSYNPQGPAPPQHSVPQEPGHGMRYTTSVQDTSNVTDYAASHPAPMRQQPPDGGHSRYTMSQRTPWDSRMPMPQPKPQAQEGHPHFHNPRHGMTTPHPSDFVPGSHPQTPGAGPAPSGADAAKLKHMLETVVADLRDTEGELATARRDCAAAQRKAAEVEEENAELQAKVRELSDMKARLSTDLHAAAEKLQSTTGSQDAILSKVEAMERDELLAGTVVVRLSEHITAVEEMTSHSRSNVDSMLTELHALACDIQTALQHIAPDVAAPQPPPPPALQETDDQYGALRVLVDLAREATTTAKDAWAGFAERALAFPAELQAMEESLHKVNDGWRETREELAAMHKQHDEETRERAAAHDAQTKEMGTAHATQVEELEQALEDLREADSGKGDALTRSHQQLAHLGSVVAGVEQRYGGALREAEEEVQAMRVRLDALDAESLSLRKRAADLQSENQRLCDARDRLEQTLAREVDEQRRLSDLVAENMAETDSKAGTVMSLEKQLRAAKEDEQRFTSELNKLHTVRVEKDQDLATLKDRCQDAEEQLASLRDDHASVLAEVTELRKTLRQRERDAAKKSREGDNMQVKINVLTDDLDQATRLLATAEADAKAAQENEAKAVKEASYFRAILLHKGHAPGQQGPGRAPSASIASQLPQDGGRTQTAEGAFAHAARPGPHEAIRRTSPPRPKPGGGGGGDLHDILRQEPAADDSLLASSNLLGQLAATMSTQQPAASRSRSHPSPTGYAPEPNHDDSLLPDHISGLRRHLSHGGGSPPPSMVSPMQHALPHHRPAAAVTHGSERRGHQQRWGGATAGAGGAQLPAAPASSQHRAEDVGERLKAMLQVDESQRAMYDFLLPTGVGAVGPPSSVPSNPLGAGPPLP